MKPEVIWSFINNHWGAHNSHIGFTLCGTSAVANLCLNLEQENDTHRSGCHLFLGAHNEFSANCKALGFSFLAREAEKTVSTQKFHSLPLVFVTCACTQGGAGDRKSTDPEESSDELWVVSAVWFIYSLYVYLWEDLRMSDATLTQ